MRISHARSARQVILYTAQPLCHDGGSAIFPVYADPTLLFSCFCLLVGDTLFGFDTASFSGILANLGERTVPTSWLQRARSKSYRSSGSKLTMRRVSVL